MFFLSASGVWYRRLRKFKVVSGYTGGHMENLTYEEVCTGHREAVQISFDPEVFPYDKLLEIYWPQIDPTESGQFQDGGES